MGYSYFAASGERPWSKTVPLISVMLLLKLGFFGALDFPYRYPVWLQPVLVPPSCFTWVLFPMSMVLPFFYNNLEMTAFP